MVSRFRKKASELFQEHIGHNNFEINLSANDSKVRTDYGIHYHFFAVDCSKDEDYSVYIHTLTEDGFIMKNLWVYS